MVFKSFFFFFFFFYIFYFLFNTATPAVLYYLEVYDSNGVLQWTMDDYIPPSGTGGSIITTNSNLNNLIVNSPMWRMINQNNSTSPPAAVSPGQFKVIAPGAHAGFSNNANNSAGLYTGSDIVFLKNSTGESDTVNFVLFPTGVKTLTTDVTPLGYFNYTCPTTMTGTVRCLQVPITRNVQNLSGQPVTISFWARANSGATSFTLNWFQFYGDSGGSPSSPQSFNVFTLTNGWAFYTFTTTVPDATGKTLGKCGNDALFLQFQYSVSASQSINIDFTLPRMYLGNIALALDYQSNDAIDAIINSPRTGNIKVGYSTVAEYGYVLMNDGTLGISGSGATAYAGSDAFALYNLLYQNVTRPSSNTICVVTGYTGDAVADFAAGNVMNLPKALGRAIAQAGLATGSGITTWVLGQAGGTQTPSIAVNQLPQHTHDRPSGSSFVTQGPGNHVYQGANNAGDTFTITGGISGFTAQAGFDVTQPSSFMNFFIKL